MAKVETTNDRERRETERMGDMVVVQNKPSLDDERCPAGLR